jgi:hypothetical protein
LLSGRYDEQLAHEHQARRVVGRREVRHAALAVHARAAEFLGGRVLVRHRLHHVGPGDVHEARALDHEHEVGDDGE